MKEAIFNEIVERIERILLGFRMSLGSAGGLRKDSTAFCVEERNDCMEIADQQLNGRDSRSERQ